MAHLFISLLSGYGGLEGFSFVCFFPTEEVALGASAKVTVAGGWFVDGFAQVEGFDDAAGGEGKCFADGI